MAIGSVKTVLLIGIFLSVFEAHAQIQPEPVEPELEVEVRSPIVRVVPRDYSPDIVFRGPCDLTKQQKDIAWKNVLDALEARYPELSKYCETMPSPTTKLFVVVDGMCRAHVACSKIVDGVEILNGYIVVEVDESTQEVRGIIDVAR